MCWVMGCVAASGNAVAEKIDKILQQDSEGLIASQQAQIKVEGLDDKHLEVIEQYRQVIRAQQLADKYHQLLVKQVAQLENALVAMDESQAQLRLTRMMLGPLLEDMVVSLAQFVAADAPFLLAERQARIENLRRQLFDASLSEGEKTLSVLDAYQVELSYGYTTESWQGKLDGNLVNFVRVGRLGFYYFTPDEAKAGVWDQGWQPLSAEWIRSIKHAAQVAQGQQLPTLLTLPAVKIETM
ncbi:DUF3450 family protein [Vibrio sp. V26_P1S5P106]|uniref:DUF3450 domain-containing protein n=1 Tax=Vibrio sp. V28_P6S34P95 TaxID=1938680 RepID=UPI001372D9CC|nr:DUF3450 domain-containing protein [Vibrio sp. V28_P6S34P95]NAX05401.1 DUF3450 family protein [Vibrio sp. V30_P3S12P165]NAX39457.1 DUF3450 family protein [Vibrio sp. V26_P1S5P106]